MPMIYDIDLPQLCGCSECSHLWDLWVRKYHGRDTMAEAYASLLRDKGVTWVGYKHLNGAILRRWSQSGLEYIKSRAWKIAMKD